MSAKILSLDIQRGEGSVLDIASMSTLADLHILSHHREHPIDAIVPGRGDIVFSISKTIHIVRFSTLSMLDLTADNIRESSLWRAEREVVYPRSIDLVPPLATPHGALDIRSSTPLRSTRQYADLFARSLPKSLMARRIARESMRSVSRHRRQIASAAITLAIITIPLIWYIKYSIETGYARLSDLRNVTDIASLESNIRDARGYFERSELLLTPISWIPLPLISLVDQASGGGLAISRALDTIVSALPTGDITRSVSQSDSLSPTYRAESRDIYTLEGLGISDPTLWLREHRGEIEKTLEYLDQAKSAYHSSDPTTLEGQKMEKVSALLTHVTKYLHVYLDNEADILTLLGHENPSRYIVFNQNRDEIRANGGFPGSIMTATLYNGNVLDYRQDDIYYYDWNLYPYKEIPPPGIALLTDNYGLRDVNYYPDFRTTLDRANSFVERSGEPTITSGVAIHQGMIEDILRVIGPVTLSGVSVPFTADNFSPLMSTLVEAQYGREDSAKSILFRFIEAFADRIIETRNYDAVFSALEKSWNDGEILFASRDPAIDRIIANFRKDLPWECGVSDTTDAGGSVTDEKNIGSGNSIATESIVKKNTCRANWLYPVVTSVSGNKSDRYIERTYEAETTPIRACRFENKVALTHSNIYTKSDTTIIRGYMDQFGITDKGEREKLEFIQGNGSNKAFVRLYAPIGSALSVQSPDIQTTTNESATVFSLTLDTPVGATVSKTFRYTTTIENCTATDTRVDWTRQPGMRTLMTKSR